MDNTTLNAGSGGDTIRTLDDGTVKWPAGVTAFATTVGTPDVLAIVTPTNGLPVHQQTGATWAVSLASIPLAADAATATLQGTGNTSLASIDGKLSGALTVATHAVTQSGTWTVTGTGGTFPVTDSGGSLTVDAPVGAPVFVRLSDGTSAIATLPVSAAALPLPTGAATEATLSTLNGKVTACNTGAVTIGTALPAGANNIGDVDVLTLPAITLAAAQTLATVTTVGTVTTLTGITNTVTTKDLPVTSGGLTMSHTVSAASTNATSVKASAGQVYDVQVFNTNASPRYLKLYNKASAPTVGTDTPVKTILVPGNTAGAGVVKEWAKGLEFTTGIAFALTTGVANSDTGAVAANEILVEIDFK